MSEIENFSNKIDAFAMQRANDKWAELVRSIEHALSAGWQKGYTDSETESLKKRMISAVEGVGGVWKDKFIQHHYKAYLDKFLSNYKSLTEFFEKQDSEGEE